MDSRYLFMEGGIVEGEGIVMRAHVGCERDRCLMRE
jgi:hypothetical protein